MARAQKNQVVSIKKPWYQKLWFFAAVVVVFGAIGTYFIVSSSASQRVYRTTSFSNKTVYPDKHGNFGIGWTVSTAGNYRVCYTIANKQSGWNNSVTLYATYANGSSIGKKSVSITKTAATTSCSNSAWFAKGARITPDVYNIGSFNPQQNTRMIINVSAISIERM